MQAFKLIEVQKSRDFGQTLTVTFNFLGQNIKNFTKSLFYIAAIPLLVAIIFSNFILPEMMSGFQPSGINPQFMVQQLPTIFISSLASALVSLVATVFITIIPVIYIKLYMEKKTNEISVNEVWLQVKRLFFKILLAEIGVAFIIGIAFLFLIIPGIYVSIAFCLMPVIIVIEDSSFSESIGRSSRLISGHWWFTLGLFIVLYIILVVISVVLTVPTYILSFVSAISSSDPRTFMQTDWKFKLATSLSGVSHLFYSFFTTALTFHYFSLKEKKEATGLFEKIDSMSSHSDAQEPVI